MTFIVRYAVQKDLYKDVYDMDSEGMVSLRSDVPPNIDCRRLP